MKANKNSSLSSKECLWVEGKMPKKQTENKLFFILVLIFKTKMSEKMLKDLCKSLFLTLTKKS